MREVSISTSIPERFLTGQCVVTDAQSDEIETWYAIRSAISAFLLFKNTERTSELYGCSPPQEARLHQFCYEGEQMTTTKVKTSELVGAALDWAVAKALDYKPYLVDQGAGPDAWMTQVPWGGMAVIGEDGWSPSTDWAQGGRLFQTYISAMNDTGSGCWCHCGNNLGEGETILIAACRAIVAAKLGDTVEIPTELLEVVQ